MVEALTIVLAVGITRGWRSALWGVAAALVALVLIIGVLGSGAHRHSRSTRSALVVGTVLLDLRPAVVAQGDPARRRPQSAARRGRDLPRRGRARWNRPTERPRHDWYSFTVSFKGVFLEGLEVAFIVVTFGSTQANVGLAAIGAGAALVVVLSPASSPMHRSHASPRTR